MDLFMKIEFFVICNVLEKIFNKEKFFSNQSQTCNGLGKRFSYFLTTLYSTSFINLIFIHTQGQIEIYPATTQTIIKRSILGKDFKVFGM